MTRRTDPPHDPEVVYTLRLVFSARASGSVREANAAEFQGSQVTIPRARDLVRQYGAEAELRDVDGHLRWVVGRGGALLAKRRPGAGPKPRRPEGAATANVNVRVTPERRDRIAEACAELGLTVTQAVELLPTLLRVVRRVGPALEWHPPVPLPDLEPRRHERIFANLAPNRTRCGLVHPWPGGTEQPPPGLWCGELLDEHGSVVDVANRERIASAIAAGEITCPECIGRGPASPSAC